MAKSNAVRGWWQRSNWMAAAVAIAAVGLPGQAGAQNAGPATREIKASAGREVRVAVYANIRPDCTPGPLPSIRLAKPPAHGAVVVKRAQLKATNLKQCLAVEVPAFVAFYRAGAGFSGEDGFDLEIAAVGGARKLEHFHVNVGGDAGQGI